MSTNPQFQDRTLTCIECSDRFIFSAGEQAYFQKKGFTNEPKHCKTCRQLKKQRYQEQRERDRQNNRGYGHR